MRDRLGGDRADVGGSPVPPGAYELFAAMPDGAAYGFLEVQPDRSGEYGNIPLLAPPTVDWDLRDAQSKTSRTKPVTLLARRDDLWGSNIVIPLKPRQALPPGFWRIAAYVDDFKDYVESIAGFGLREQRPWRKERAPGAHEVFIRPVALTRLQVTISGKVGEIASLVKGDDVAGASVFLSAVNPELQPVAYPDRATVGTDGKFSLQGLPQGTYRMVATFDATSASPELFDESQVQTVTVEANRITPIDLTLWRALTVNGR